MEGEVGHDRGYIGSSLAFAHLRVREKLKKFNREIVASRDLTP